MKKNSLRKTIFSISLLLAIVWMFVIYGFSANDAQESTIQSNAVTEIIIRIFNPEFDSMTEWEQSDMISRYDGIVRKVAHFVAYAVLGFLVYLCFANAPFTCGEKLFTYIAFAMPFCVIFAAFDEYHQTMVDGRAGRFSDVVIDGSGAACGILSAVCAILVLKKIIERRNEGI